MTHKDVFLFFVFFFYGRYCESVGKIAGISFFLTTEDTELQQRQESEPGEMMTMLPQGAES